MYKLELLESPPDERQQGKQNQLSAWQREKFSLSMLISALIGEIPPVSINLVILHALVW